LSGSDAEIIKLARRGDPLAWENLVIRYTKRIYNLCYRFVGRADLAEDLTQEVFIKVFRNLNSYNSEAGSFLTWIISLTRNLLVDHYRQSKGERATVSTEEGHELSLLETLPSHTPSPHTELEEKEKLDILKRGLNLLSPDLREAVILRDLEDLSYQEIGNILKVPDGTVKSRINRGRVELARILQRFRSHSQGFSG
jgi:RNA polymerase sigma-70 factor (ECF subfamily)